MYIISGLIGSIAISETPKLVRKSVEVDHVCPLLFDFQKPPAGAPI